MLEAAEADLRAGARAAVLRAFAWGFAVTAALIAVATLIWRNLRPRWVLAAAGATFALAAGGGSMIMAQSTFDARAFESPTYFARGAELGRILEVAEEERVRSDYGSTFASVLRGISALLVREPANDAATRELYLASDLHANALVIDPLADAIGSEPVIFAGDFGQRGGEAEARLLAPRVAALGDRVIAVSGNHDSSRLMRTLHDAGVSVLRSRAVLTPSRGYLPSPLLEVNG
ncbi:MAG: metallophosphoesterase family protein, partial [Candidatus Limnocylindria bacterium]